MDVCVCVFSFLRSNISALQKSRRPCCIKCTSDIKPLRQRRQFQRFFPSKSLGKVGETSRVPAESGRRLVPAPSQAQPGGEASSPPPANEHKRFTLRDDARLAHTGIRGTPLCLFQPLLALAFLAGIMSKNGGKEIKPRVP